MIVEPDLFSASEPVFVVGCGTSIRDAVFPNWRKLSKRQLVVTNMAAAFFPQAAVHCTIDGGWWSAHPEMAREFSGLRCVAVEHLSRLPHTRQRGQHDEIFFDRVKGAFCLNPRGLAGSFSGHAAINLAYHLGAREIVLLGFDGYRAGAPLHWYGSRVAEESETGPQFDGYARQMGALADAGQKAGVEILNASPGSKLSCFARVKLEVLL